MSALAIIAIVAGGVLLLVTVTGLIGPLVGHASRSTAARVAELGFPATRQSGANSLGVTSLGKAQVRGNGTLALSDAELLFVLAVPRRETRIALNRIVKVDTTKSHLGKTIGRKLLRVTWTTAAGTDSIALYVSDLEGWIAAIEAAQ